MEHVTTLYVPDGTTDELAETHKKAAIEGWYDSVELSELLPAGPPPTTEFVRGAHPNLQCGHADGWVVLGEVMPLGHAPG